MAITVTNRIHIYAITKLVSGSFSLDPLCAAAGHILALYVRVRGEFVLSGDMLKSMSVWRLTGANDVAKAIALQKAVGGGDDDGGDAAASALQAAKKNASFHLIAVDYAPNWLSAIEMLSDDVYLGAEDDDNLLTLRRNDDAPTDEERARLDTVGVYHVGEYINVFRKGSLVMRPSAQDEDVPQVETVLFGSTTGALGVIASLEKSDFDFFHKIQVAMQQVVHGVGGFVHENWRAMRTQRRSSPAARYLDGDLIELVRNEWKKRKRNTDEEIELPIFYLQDFLLFFFLSQLWKWFVPFRLLPSCLIVFELSTK